MIHGENIIPQAYVTLLKNDCVDFLSHPSALKTIKDAKWYNYFQFPTNSIELIKTGNSYILISLTLKKTQPDFNYKIYYSTAKKLISQIFEQTFISVSPTAAQSWTSYFWQDDWIVFQVLGSSREFHFVHRALPHARTKRSVPHTRRLKADPLVSFHSRRFIEARAAIPPHMPGCRDTKSNHKSNCHFCKQCVCVSAKVCSLRCCPRIESFFTGCVRREIDISKRN